MIEKLTNKIFTYFLERKPRGPVIGRNLKKQVLHVTIFGDVTSLRSTLKDNGLFKKCIGFKYARSGLKKGSNIKNMTVPNEENIC